MSKKHRDQVANSGSDTTSSSGGYAGKRTLTSRLPAKPKAAAADVDSAADADLGPGDEYRPPLHSHIIDFNRRDDGSTLITVSVGAARMTPAYSTATVVTEDDRQLADATIIADGQTANATILNTKLSMETMEQAKALVKFVDDPS